MPCICYKEQRFNHSSRIIIDAANTIIAEYAAQGFDLTLRQLFYQFVSRDLIKNTIKSYKRLGSIVNDARLAGEIDWDAITDRTRNLHSLGTWDTPASIARAAAQSFQIDMWRNQKHRVEVWIEKEALAGVFTPICDELRVGLFPCRGYTSQSEMHVAAIRLRSYDENGQTPIILHFGDHDPSGMDMSRDIDDRLSMFMGGMDVQRLALNMDQVRTHKPPPNPAKITDSRAKEYIKRHGNKSWELDALNPDILAGLVRTNVNSFINKKIWKADLKIEAEGRRLLTAVSYNWDSVTRGL